MKKYRLTNFFTNTLIIIEFLLFVLISAEVEDTTIFIISKTILIIMFLSIYQIITKYGK